MWIAKVVRTERIEAKLNIIVHYANDKSEQYDDVYSTTIAQGDSWLTDQINSRLTQLNSLDDFQQTLEDTNIEGKSYQVDPQTTDLVEVIK